MIFQVGETVICSVEVRDENNNLVDPATSMKITITDNRNGLEVDSVDMTRDDDGFYHYDWQTSTVELMGIYNILYTAVDGTRISIATDAVEIH